MYSRLVTVQTKPKLPAIMSIATVTLLMPSVLFLVNFTTVPNACIVVALITLVVLDRINLRNDSRKAFQAEQEAIAAYLKQVEASTAGGGTPPADTSETPKNKDGETLH